MIYWIRCNKRNNSFIIRKNYTCSSKLIHTLLQIDLEPQQDDNDHNMLILKDALNEILLYPLYNL